MSYHINPGETLAESAKRIALERVDKVLKLLTEPTRNRHKAVHSVRKSFKRIRAVMRLVRDEIGYEIYRRENVCYRDASRRLAPVRDGTVLVETVDVLKEHFAEALAPQAFAGIRARLVEHHAAVSHKLLDEEDVMAEVAEVVRTARPRIEALPFIHENFKAVRGGLRRVYRRGRKRMARAYAPPHHSERFHDWRKRVKYCWYQMEILHPIWPQILSPLAEELHQVSKYLGDAHDMAELRLFLLQQEALFGRERDLPTLVALTHQRERELETAARPLAQRLYVDRPGRFVTRLATYWQAWQTDLEQGTMRISPDKSGQKKKSSPDGLVSTREAAAYLSLGRRQVRRLIRSGQLPARKVSGVWIIDQAQLDRI